MMEDAQDFGRHPAFTSAENRMAKFAVNAGGATFGGQLC
jgi:hypothetical protein